MSDPGPSASMLHKAVIEIAEKNKFSNSTRDTISVEQNNYNLNIQGENRVSGLLELHDAIVHLLNISPHFVEEVRKNDHSRSTVNDRTVADGSDPPPQAVSTPQSSFSEVEPIEISDIVPADPSSLPVSSIADRYTRSMLKCLRGYPLYNPKPFSELLNEEYLRNGVNVGDVGFVRGTSGTFDFLFNICPSRNGLINPPNLPDGFSLETSYHSGTTDLESLPRNSCFFERPEGAILELPEGAVRDEAVNMLPLKNLAARHGVEWYKYTMSRGRDISNGALYLITSVTKCAQWGIAVFDRPCASGQGLTFDSKTSSPFSLWKSTSRYHWNGSNVSNTKIANPNQGNALNQCVFVQGYKIMIRQDIFNTLCKDQLRGSAMHSSSPEAGSSSLTITRQRARRIRGGAGPDPVSKLKGSPLAWTTNSTLTPSDEVTLHADFSSSLIHPSDLINAALLSQYPSAKVALTHDDVWRNLLRDNFPKFNHATLTNIAQSYTNVIDEYDCVSLQEKTYTHWREGEPYKNVESPLTTIVASQFSQSATRPSAFGPHNHGQYQSSPHYQNPAIKLPRNLPRPPVVDIPRDAITAVAPELENVPTEYILGNLKLKAKAMISGNAALGASLPSSLPNTHLPLTMTISVRAPSENEYPTHILAMSSSSSSDQVRLFPVHALVLASQCAHLPRLPASQPNPSSSQVTLPVLPVSVPSLAAFSILHQFVYHHRLDLVLKALLPLPPDFLQSISHQTIRATLSSETSLRQLSNHLCSSASSNSQLEALMEHATHVKELWQNMVALGLNDPELWDTIDLAWEIVLGALDLAADNYSHQSLIDTRQDSYMSWEKSKVAKTVI